MEKLTDNELNKATGGEEVSGNNDACELFLEEYYGAPRKCQWCLYYGSIPGYMGVGKCSKK